jgi:enamine deaminase RidA (YjgF/YER057c/UK114 family)
VEDVMIERINPMPRWSDVVMYNGSAYFVEVPDRVDCDIVGQVDQVLLQAEARLARFDSDKSRLLSATIYVAHRDLLPVVNAAWEAWLPTGCAPSRACLIVELVNPEMLVEMAFIAAC